MMVSVNNPVAQTYLFALLLLIIIIFSLRRRQDESLFPVSVSQELKGVAMLAVIIAHVTYALVDDTRFLAPFAGFAGAGVDIFLLLSGYGLMASELKRHLSTRQFYQRRFLHLYLPLWLVLAIFFVVDALMGKFYDTPYIVQSFLGWFSSADLYRDVNSPLWYFSWIIFYYLLFPLLYIRKYPWLSPLLMLIAVKAVLFSEPEFLKVSYLYELHVWAFPFGMFLGWLFNASPLSEKISGFFQRLRTSQVGHYPALLMLAAVLLYFYYNSPVGQSLKYEQFGNILIILLLIMVFLIKNRQSLFLQVIGLMSYEIYLLHWPLMYRYGIIFKYLPAGLAVVVYLGIFIALAYILRYVSARLTGSDGRPSWPARLFKRQKTYV